MAIKTRDEILESVKNIVGDNMSDDTISFIEDMTDTMNDYETRLSNSTDWKSKYETNDEEWRRKYTERFFAKNDNDGNGIDDSDSHNDGADDEAPKTYEDLFE